jgi:hypothetical protein
MYAYLDETGNTGDNLFDKNQPIFLTGALITKTNFDILYKGKINKICQKLGATSLHANELGFRKLDDIAQDLLKILKKSDGRIFLFKIVKKDLALTKLVDTIFDSGENLAVPWHIYNYKVLRLLIVIKLAYILNEDILKLFWSSLMELKENRAYIKFRNVLTEILVNVKELPDERSREIVSEAIKWAIENPETIHLHVNERIHKYGHLPNIVAFPSLLGGIDILSEKWDRPVLEIIHDRQSQFESTLKVWHEILSNAKPDIIILPGGDKERIRKVFGSKFKISNSDESAGIQVIDIILWLFKKIDDGNSIPSNCAKLMNEVFRKGFYDEISLKGISTYLEDIFEEIDKATISPEQMEHANELLEFAETRRQEIMKEYLEQKYKIIS